MHDAERVRLIDEALEREGFDAVVCGSPPNVLMLTGYWPMTGASVSIRVRGVRDWLIIPADEKHLAADRDTVTYRLSSLDRLTTAMDSIREPLRSVVADAQLNGARIGIEESPQFVPVPYASVQSWGPSISVLLRELCPKSQFIDAGFMLRRLRATLTAAERHKLRHACLVAADAFAVARALIAPGTTERQVAGSVQAGFLAADAARTGGFAFCMSGPNSAHAGRAYAYSGLRRLEEGDLVLIHCNSYVGGYWTDITRTYTVGPVDGRKRDMYEAVFRAREAALRAVRPGVTGADVDKAARQSLAESGFGPHFTHATGHGVGFAAIDHDAIPRIHPASPDRLKPGMVFNIGPAIYIEEFGGIRHCDLAAVTEQGTEMLTPFHDAIPDLELVQTTGASR